MSERTPESATASLPDPARASAGKGALYQTASTTATDYWNDSCSVEELTYAIERGAVGATTNPTIVGAVLKKEMHLWRERIAEIVALNPTWTEDEHHLAADRGDGDARRRAAAPRLRARRRHKGASFDPDRPDASTATPRASPSRLRTSAPSPRTCRSRSP